MANSTRRVWATAIGEAPRWCWNSRRSWRPPTPSRSASTSTSASLAVECALGDQRQRAAHRVGGAAPEGEVGRDLGPAAQAGPEPRLLRGRGRGEEAAVLELGQARRADRPAVDAGRGDAHEHTAVEAGVVGLEGAVVGSAVEQFHDRNLGCAGVGRSRFSDLIQIRPRLPRPSHATKNSVIAGAERSACPERSRTEAKWRDLLCCLGDKRRSLDYAARWAASLGMTI